MGAIAQVIGFAVIGFVIYAWITGAATASAADCRIVEIKTQADTYLRNEGPDFGYTVNSAVQNQGETGNVSVKASLSTSEGNFERTQVLSIDAGERVNLSYQFHEPSVNASNVQSRIECSPSKKRS